MAFSARLIGVALVAASAGLASAATPVPLENADFEVGAVFDPGDFGYGHANLPAPWSSPSPGNGFVSGDTWSHLGGTRGLLPNVNGVFDPSMTAANGDRWAGAWNFEYISQPLSAALVEGEEYSVFANVHASNYGPGGSIEISFGTSVGDRTLVAGVLPGTTTLADGWQAKTLTFTVTAEMAAATWFHFRPINTIDSSDVYMAVDVIPAPASVGVVVMGVGLVVRRRR
jgi:hypothetical protein